MHSKVPQSAGGHRHHGPGDRHHRCDNPLLETELRFCLKKWPQLDGETDGARSPGEAPGEPGTTVRQKPRRGQDRGVVAWARAEHSRRRRRGRRRKEEGRREKGEGGRTDADVKSRTFNTVEENNPEARLQHVILK